MKKNFKLLILFILLTVFIPVIALADEINIDFANEFNGVNWQIRGNSFLLDGGTSDASNDMHYKISTDNKIIYCIDGNKEYPVPAEPKVVSFDTECGSYSSNTRGENVSKALAYIYTYGYGTHKSDDNQLSTKYLTGDRKKDYYITQMAVWHYTEPPTWMTSYFNYENHTYKGISSDITVKVSNLIKDAAAATPSIEISASNKTMTLTSDKKYYISAPIVLNGNYLNSNITVSLSGTSGAFVTTNKDSTSGQTSFSSGTTVYIKVPSANVANSASVTLSASATSQITGGEIVSCRTAYDPEGRQRVIKFNPKETSVKAEITVTVSKVPVKISKRSITGSAELPGARLVIKRDGTEIDSWLSTNEVHTVQLDPGTYTLEETIAPDGYIKSTSTITFEVKADGKVYVNGSAVEQVVMTNEPIKVKISKKDITSKTELEGARLKITDTSGKTAKDLAGNLLEWTSGKTAKEFNIKPGTYILVETTAPKGYKLSESKITFVVGSDGKVKVNNQIVSAVEMTNEPIKVKISKKDITGKAELEGAKLKITDSKGKVVKDMEGNDLSWTSGSTAKEFWLAAGTYYLSETNAPKGYKLSSKTIKFSVDDKGKITVDGEEVTIVAMINEKINVKISKRNIIGSDELPGATLKITDKDGKTLTDMEGNELVWVSGTKPKEFWLKAGTYYLTETIAPEGYELSEKTIEFTVNSAGNVFVNGKEVKNDTVIFTNTPEPIPVETGDAIFIAVLIIGVIAVGVSAYYILKKYKK